MAQFGTGKNPPPWAREAHAMGQPGVASINLSQQQVGVPTSALIQPGIATPTVYSMGGSQPGMVPQQFTAQQLGVASLQVGVQPGQPMPTAVQLSQPGIAIPSTLATTQLATVSYPTPRAAAQVNAGQQPKQRVFTGTVTKLHENFGFVDEDVFFQTSSVKGNLPKVGDRVLVEATYNANMPFKWNATRIQLLPNQPALNPGSGFGHGGHVQSSGGSGFGMKPGGMGGGMQQSGMTPPNISQPPPPLMAQPAQPTPAGLLQAPAGGRPGIAPSRRPDPPSYRDRDRDRGRDRDRHTHDRRERRSPRKRSRSPRRSRSPSSRARSPPRNRRPTRIVPRYMVQIPKLSLDTKLANVIALKSRYTNMYVPSDFFNTTFSWTEAFPLHRPFPLGQQCSFHVMHKEVTPIDQQEAVLEPQDADHLWSAKVMLMSCPTLDDMYHKSCALAEDPPEMRENFQHPTRLIQFLVGLKGKSEPMAIGGPWSPSLDGPNPEEDPGVLINTAIRTTKALTGIDLSSCTQWYRFTEIRYHRPEEVHKGRLVPARVETVVLFLPDVWSCLPTRLEWDQLVASYKKQLQDKVTSEAREDSQEDEEGEDGAGAEKTDPTHFSELDPKNMKVADLRRELECRQLSSKGLKSQLIARLTKAIKSEQEKEEQEAENKEEEEEKPEEKQEKEETDAREEEKKKKEEEEKKRKEEREKATRERRYTLPENPTVVVHPSPVAKGGKFDCTAMSLSVLLDYRPEDNKEHSFEVSLFAELVNEMLMRDFGFRIYKSLATAPDRKEEEKKDKDHQKESKEKDHKENKEQKEQEKKEDKDGEKTKDDKLKADEAEEPSAKKRKASQDEKEDKKKDDDKKDKKDSSHDRKEKEKEEDHEEEESNEDDDKMSSLSGSQRDKERRDRKDKDKKREKLRFVTTQPNLLLAFVYFDQSHTGYLLDRDVEEILHTIGLHLSRAQVKKLVQKLVSRDTLNYRKITDKPKDKELKEGEKKEEQKTEESPSKTEEKMDVSVEGQEEGLPDILTLAQGNRPLLHLVESEPDLPGVSTPNRRRSGTEAVGKEKPTSSGMVMYNGSVLDINSVMHRLEKSEKGRTAIESKLKEVLEEMDILKTSFSSSEQNSQKVALELQESKKKLRDQRKATDTAEHSAKKYLDILSKSRDCLTSLLGQVKDVIPDENNGFDLKSVKKEKTEGVNGE